MSVTTTLIPVLVAEGALKGAAKTLPRLYEERQKLSREGGIAHFYPHYSRPVDFVSPARLHELYGRISRDDLHTQKITVTIGGRVLALRELSSHLTFADLMHNGERAQIIINSQNFSSKEAFQTAIKSLQRGDIVEASGVVARTRSGELSVAASEISVKAPCIRNIPDRNAPEMNTEHRSRWRYLDLIARPEALGIFKTRSKVVQLVREFLSKRDFTEVETPVLSTSAGGASARPFQTELLDMQLPLTLRIAPELYLKQLIVAGLDRVFEIGKVFRNEGLDATHNPEFTSLEMYQSFAAMENMIELVEALLSDHTINLAPPFKRVDILSALESKTGIRVPVADLSKAAQTCSEILQRHGVPFDQTNSSPSYLLDKLIGHFLEPECIQPTFLINHPTFQSPLAKESPNNPSLSSRFELFIGGREIANGYSELNDPHQQRHRFALQTAELRAGNREAHPADDAFVEALEAAMPPTAGCGIGLDRLVMLFTNQYHIRDVLFFPLMKPLRK